jgi:hypothetical protein
MGKDPGRTPPEPPSGNSPPPFEPDPHLITLLEGSGREDPRDIWLAKYGPDVTVPIWRRLLRRIVRDP